MFHPEVTGPAKKAMTAAQKDADVKLSLVSKTVFDVVILGAGITGAAAAFHLQQNKKKPTSILLLDHGEIGAGSHDRFVSKATVPTSQNYKSPNDNLGDEKVYHLGNSGGVLFSPPHFKNGPGCVKMSVRLYPSTTANFIQHHGEIGARRYLKLSALGIEIQKKLNKVLVPSNEQKKVIEEAGSILLAEQADADNMKEEWELLQKCGVEDAVWWDEKKVESIHGKDSGFVCGIYFPKDTRVDALLFTRALVKAAAVASECAVTVIEHCPSLVDVNDVGNFAQCVFQNGVVINSNHAVVATNGLFLNKTLAGILRPCWSYFVALPHGRDPLNTPLEGPMDESKFPSSSAGVVTSPFTKSNKLLGGAQSFNFFTYGFTHDWCVTQGAYRISGADHYSSLKAPRSPVRCGNLAKWTLTKYPHMKNALGVSDPSDVLPTGDQSKYSKALQGRCVYGVYSETPDSLPLIGKTNASSRICYAVGCNAWGQASMSYAAYVIPGLLGFTELSAEDAELADLFAISRFKSLEWYNRVVPSKL